MRETRRVSTRFSTYLRYSLVTLPDEASSPRWYFVSFYDESGLIVRDDV